MTALFRLSRLLSLGLLALGLQGAAHAQGAPTVSPPLPAPLQSIDYDGLRDIRFRPARALWRDAQLPFETMFFHRGLYQREAVQVHEITPQGVRPLPYDSGDYDFGKNSFQ